MPTIWERFKRRLTTGQREREEDRRQQSIQTPLQTQQLPQGVLTEEQRLQSVERQPNIITGGRMTPDIQQTLDPTQIAPEGRFGEEEVQLAEFRPPSRSMQDIFEDIERQGFKQVMDEDFRRTQKMIPSMKEGFITLTNQNTGEEFKLTHEEYLALGKKEGGELTPQVEQIRMQRITLDRTRAWLTAQLTDEALSVELRRRFSGALRDLKWSQGKLDSIEQAQQILADWDIDLPPQLMADLGVTGTIKSTGAGISAATIAKGAFKAGSRATGIVGFLAWATVTLGSQAYAKQKNVNFADRIRTRVETELTTIDSDLATGDISPSEAVFKYNKAVELARASEVILKTEQDKFLGKELSDVDDKMVEVQTLLNSMLPTTQRNIEAAMTGRFISPETAAAPI